MQAARRARSSASRRHGGGIAGGGVAADGVEERAPVGALRAVADDKEAAQRARGVEHGRGARGRHGGEDAHEVGSVGGAEQRAGCVEARTQGDAGSGCQSAASASPGCVQALALVISTKSADSAQGRRAVSRSGSSVQGGPTKTGTQKLATTSATREVEGRSPGSSGQ